jgi:hypothetical protein
VEGPAVLSSTNEYHLKAPPYDLSSRPKRSAVEGPAVLSSTNECRLKSAALRFVIPTEVEEPAVLSSANECHLKAPPPSWLILPRSLIFQSI